MSKTTLKCKCCGEFILSNEGFVTKRNKYSHFPSCERPLKPHQCKIYSAENKEDSVHIPSREMAIKLKIGFSYAS